MPTKIFTHFDVVNVVQGWNSGPTEIGGSIALVNTNIFNFGISGSGSQTGDISQVFSVGGGYEFTGNIEYDRSINPVSPNASITEIKIRRPCSVTGTISAETDDIPPNDLITAGIGGNPAIFFFEDISLTIPGPIEVAESVMDGASPFSASPNESISGSASDHIIDLSGSPITRDQLIAQYSLIRVFVGGGVGGNQNAVWVMHSSGSFNSEVSGIEVHITYEETFSYLWTVHQPNEPVITGTEITVTSPDEDHIEPPDISVDLDDVTDINILIPDLDNPGQFFTVPVLTFTAVSPRLLTIIFPDVTGFPPTTVCYVELTSTQFEGSIAEVIYLPLFVSASGIYQLEMGKASDTLYIEELPGETIDVKIPDPFGKTGFFGK